MAVIGQPIVPPSTEAIGSPAGLRSAMLVGAEPLVRKQVDDEYSGTITSIDGVSGPAALAYAVKPVKRSLKVISARYRCGGQCASRT